MTEYNDDYPTCSSTYATLRIYPGDVSLDGITARLDVTPTSTQLLRNDRRATRTCLLVGSSLPKTLWNHATFGVTLIGYLTRSRTNPTYSRGCATLAYRLISRATGPLHPVMAALRCRRRKWRFLECSVLKSGSMFTPVDVPRSHKSGSRTGFPARPPHHRIRRSASPTRRLDVITYGVCWPDPILLFAVSRMERQTGVTPLGVVKIVAAYNTFEILLWCTLAVAVLIRGRTRQRTRVRWYVAAATLSFSPRQMPWKS